MTWMSENLLRYKTQQGKIVPLRVKLLFHWSKNTLGPTNICLLALMVMDSIVHSWVKCRRTALMGSERKVTPIWMCWFDKSGKANSSNNEKEGNRLFWQVYPRFNNLHIPLLFWCKRGIRNTVYWHCFECGFHHIKWHCSCSTKEKSSSGNQIGASGEIVFSHRRHHLSGSCWSSVMCTEFVSWWPQCHVPAGAQWAIRSLQSSALSATSKQSSAQCCALHVQLLHVVTVTRQGTCSFLLSVQTLALLGTFQGWLFMVLSLKTHFIPEVLWGTGNKGSSGAYLHSKIKSFIFSVLDLGV